jgi:hypothetical protein
MVSLGATWWPDQQRRSATPDRHSQRWSPQSTGSRTPPALTRMQRAASPGAFDPHPAWSGEPCCAARPPQVDPVRSGHRRQPVAPYQPLTWPSEDGPSTSPAAPPPTRWGCCASQLRFDSARTVGSRRRSRTPARPERSPHPGSPGGGADARMRARAPPGPSRAVRSSLTLRLRLRPLTGLAFLPLESRRRSRRTLAPSACVARPGGAPGRRCEQLLIGELRRRPQVSSTNDPTCRTPSTSHAGNGTPRPCPCSRTTRAVNGRAQREPAPSRRPLTAREPRLAPPSPSSAGASRGSSLPPWPPPRARPSARHRRSPHAAPYGPSDQVRAVMAHRTSPVVRPRSVTAPPGQARARCVRDSVRRRRTPQTPPDSPVQN